ncbi:MAG: hypothetical protein AB7J35_01800 [Dehalococcoidia bacterium]
MDASLWDSNFRILPALPVAAAGGGLSITGIWRQVRALRRPLDTTGRNWAWLRAMRQMLQGFAVLAIGLGWLWQIPVMIAAGAIFGLEETIETSIATWALKQEAEGREGFA